MPQKAYWVIVLALAAMSVASCARPGERPLARAMSALEDSLYVEPLSGSSDEISENASLDEWLRYAERRNPGLEASFHRWKAAIEVVPQVRSLPDPRLSYTYFLRSVETRVGPQQQAFAISQSFPWFGKLAREGDAALEAARAAERRHEALRLRLFYDVSCEYAEHYYMSRAIRITRENLELLRHWEEVARAKFRAGTGTHAEVVQAQVEIGVLTDRLRTLVDQRGVVLADFNALMSRDADADLVAPDSLSDENIGLNDTELLDLLRGASPELRALQFEIDRKQHELARARKQHYPDFTVGVGYVATGDAINPGVKDSGKDPLTASVSINVPLWLGKYGAGTRAASANLRSAQLAHEDRTFQLDARVKRVAFELRDAGRKVTLYRDTLIPKGEQSLQATSAAFEAGRLEFLNVIDAQRVLLEFQLAYERALANQLSSLARLEMLVGQRLQRRTGVR